MKKIILLPLLLLTLIVQAKKVRFSVDFGTDSASIEGVHVIGDFQTALGLPVNFTADTTDVSKLLQVGSSSIYSVVLDIPAFAKYEYLFVNGSEYETELPPLESQVTFDFKVNRFIYIDSMANDTTDLQPVKFGNNAPIGKKLLRLKVDMQNQIVNTKGVYMNGGIVGEPKKMFRMCPLGNVYHYITYTDTGKSVYEYEFINGNTLSDVEIKNTSCTNNTALRIDTFMADKELDTVCYNACKKCTPLSIVDNRISFTSIAPNPSYNGFLIASASNHYSITICNAMGQILMCKPNIDNKNFMVNALSKPGIYSIIVKDIDTHQKKVIQYIQQ